MGTPIRNAILGLNPFLYWPLDELTGLTAVDLSGNGHNGTYTANIIRGFIGLPGDSGNPAITFDGNLIATPTRGISIGGLSDSGQQSFIVHFWNSVTSFGAGSEVPFSWSGASTDGYVMQFNSASGHLNGQIGTAGGYVVIDDTESLGDFAPHWNQWVLTWNAPASTLSLYVNGALRQQNTSIALHGTPPTMALNLGYLNVSGGPTQGYTGGSSHFAIIRSVLTPTQVQQLFVASGAGPTQPLTEPTTRDLVMPSSYTLGTCTAGLTGSGTIAVPNLFGALVNLTTVPGYWGKSADIPNHYIPAAGRVLFSDLNGDDAGELIHQDHQLVWSHNRTNLFLRYWFRPGVVATICPITVP